MSDLVARLRRIVLVLPLCLAGAMIWSHSPAQVLKWPGFEKLYLSSLIRAHEADYLLKLRDTHLGCLTLEFRPADIVFIGDSHSYAGYDYAWLQERLRPALVGNCALAGMSAENVIDFIKVADPAGLLPKQLIFGISPEMFWKADKERAGYVQRARREIVKLNSARESLVDLLAGRFAVVPDFRDATAQRRALAKFDGSIATVTDAMTSRFFAEYKGGVHALDYWIEAVRTAQPDPDSAAVIRRVCEAASAHQVKVGVVFVPESRFLVSLLPPEQREAFRRVMKEFACADWVDFSFFEAGGGPDTWYINRSLVDDYPYEAWLDPESAVAWEAQDPKARRWQFFDADHMNPKGARAWSEIVAGAIQRSSN
jgi:hypothetical protein